MLRPPPAHRSAWFIGPPPFDGTPACRLSGLALAHSHRQPFVYHPGVCPIFGLRLISLVSTGSRFILSW